MFGTLRRRLTGTLAAAAIGGSIAVFSAVPAHALDAESIGKAIPHDLTVPDQTDQVRNFKALTARNGLILLFSRSLAW